MEDGEQKISKYSSGVSILIRLDQLWKDTHKHARSGVYKMWNEDLDCIWRELARDIDTKKFNDGKGDDGKTILGNKSKFNSFQGKLKKLGGFEDEGGEGFQSMKTTAVENREEQYQILMDKQLFLARLENELGKGTTFGEGDEDDFE